MCLKLPSQLKTVLFSLFFVTSTAFACINDFDTTFFESQKFPNETQLMSGDFITHSQDFYIWRAQDRLKKLEKEPNNLSYYDDLAVSYEKTNQIDKAIDTLEKIYKEHPNRYETVANLGTFYIHDKQYQKGVDLIKKAIVINPDSHFGREVYQVKIVEYILKQNPDGNIDLPVQKTKENFADFILKDIHGNKLPYLQSPDELDPSTTEILKAMIGLGGMLKFGNSDSPILLEAMGDLYTKLDQLNSSYAVDSGTTYFGKIAMLFYVAAITKNQSNQYVEENHNIEEDKFKQYLTIKQLSTTASFNTIYHSLEYFNELAIKNKNEYINKEIEYIKKGGDVEKNIYANLYPSAQVQENLFQTAKQSYFNFLAESKNEYHQFKNDKLTEELYFSAVVFTIPLIVYYVCCLPFLVAFLYRKHHEIKTISEFEPTKMVKVTGYFVLVYLLYNLINIFYYFK